ncbi:hypothetical protein HPP92_014672 [Vanilla planifolia]|uniref:Uncharacterized protein n=1 Tax=Vanilla planifolia TaxID=51239 RepID=A0A835QLZ4_VANPL|nr:hypothetical protein HPP92_014672 [Vanilla planifolia]
MRTDDRSAMALRRLEDHLNLQGGERTAVSEFKSRGKAAWVRGSPTCVREKEEGHCWERVEYEERDKSFAAWR